MDLVEYFSRSEWVDDPEAVRSSKCVIIDSINKQVSNLDTSTSISQPLMDNLDTESIELNKSLYSIRSVINEFLVF